MDHLLDFLPVAVRSNPATLMVLVSVAFTLFIGFSEMGGRNSGGEGWMTLFRLATGAVFTLLTTIVAGIFGGWLAALGYLVVQVLVCLVIPAVWVEKM